MAEALSAALVEPNTKVPELPFPDFSESPAGLGAAVAPNEKPLPGCAVSFFSWAAQLGSASCGATVCTLVLVSVVAESVIEMRGENLQVDRANMGWGLLGATVGEYGSRTKTMERPKSRLFETEQDEEEEEESQ